MAIFALSAKANWWKLLARRWLHLEKCKQITASKKPRDSIREIYDQARDALKAGNADEAEMICRRALPIHGEGPNILCLLGEILLKLKRPQQAQMAFGRVLGKVQECPRALEAVGLSLLAQ